MTAVERAHPVESPKEPNSEQRMIIDYLVDPNLPELVLKKTFLSLLGELNHHPEYESVIKSLAISLSENEKMRLIVLHAVFEYGFFDHGIRNWVPGYIWDIPKFYPPLMLGWVQLWTNVGGKIPVRLPEFIQEQLQSDVDEEEIFMMLVKDAVKAGRLTMWCELEVDGVLHDAWRYKDEIGWRDGGGYVILRKDDVQVSNVEGLKVFEAVVEGDVVRFGSGILFCLFDGDVNQWD
jgi:hypothetical protein